LLLDVTPSTLGIEIAGGFVMLMVPRNSILPCTSSNLLIFKGPELTCPFKCTRESMKRLATVRYYINLYLRSLRPFLFNPHFLLLFLFLLVLPQLLLNPLLVLTKLRKNSYK
jgi:hypothetical protein